MRIKAFTLAFLLLLGYLVSVNFAFTPFAVNYKSYAIVNFTSSAFTLPIQISNTLTLNAPTAYTYINVSAINATLAKTPYQYLLFQGYNTSGGLVGNVLALPFHSGYLIPNTTINGRPYNSLVVFWNEFYPISTIEANISKSIKVINTGFAVQYYIIGNLSYSYQENYISNNNNITTYQDVISFQPKMPYELLTTNLMPLWSNNGVVLNAQIEKMQIDYYDGKPLATHKFRYVALPQVSAMFSKEYLLGIDTFYSNNATAPWQYLQNLYFNPTYLIATNGIVAYSNYSIQNASTTYSAASGLFYNGNPYYYTLYNYQQINIKQPPLTTPYIYYFVPAYSQGYTFMANTITNPQAPKINSTSVYYEYAIPIRVNSWINYTPNFGSMDNGQQGYPGAFNTGFAEITIPYYAQMNTESGNCTGLTLVANQSYMGAIPFAIISCNPKTQTITLIARNITSNNYVWNNGYVLFGTSSNTSIANSDNQNLLINNYTIYSNPNSTSITYWFVIPIGKQEYIKFKYPLNTQTTFGTGTLTFSWGTNGREYLNPGSLTAPQSQIALGFSGWANTNVSNIVSTQLKASNPYGYAYCTYNATLSYCPGYSGGTWKYFLDISSNIAYVYAPMTTSYTLGAPQTNPFLNTSSSSSNSGLPSLVIKPPQNYLNTSVNNTAYNATNINKTISNLKLNNQTLLFGIAIPNYLFVIIDVIVLAIIAFIGEKSEAPIILALIFLTISGIFVFSMQILALAILLVYLAYDIEKWHI